MSPADAGLTPLVACSTIRPRTSKTGASCPTSLGVLTVDGQAGAVQTPGGRLDDLGNLLAFEREQAQFLLRPRETRRPVHVEGLDLVLQPPELEVLERDLALLRDPQQPDRGLGGDPVLLGCHLGSEPVLLEAKDLFRRGEVLGLHAPLAGQLRQLELLGPTKALPIADQLLLLDPALRRHLAESGLLVRPDVRLVALEPDLVADPGLEAGCAAGRRR